MENEVRKNLVVELYEKMKFAKLLAEREVVRAWNKKQTILVKNDVKLNTRYISNKQYYQIAQFRQFLNENPNLTDEEIRVVLKSDNKFSFLIKLDNLIPDFFEELKLHGTGYIATLYVDKKYSSEAFRVARI